MAKGSNTITTLASFNDANGRDPNGGLVIDGSGNLYGTTGGGGASGAGTVFELAKGSNTITTLASFNDANGKSLNGGLVMDGSVNLYGTTLEGGASDDGTVFELAQGSSTITTIVSFNGTNGADPNGGLVIDGSGNLYGTTGGGGASGAGTVFELAKGSNTITTLASFNGINGSDPNGGLIMDGSGNLYGTAKGSDGSAYGTDTVFELAKGSSTIITLASFNMANGEYQNGGLVIDSSGNLYGTTSEGGLSSTGTVFELAKGSNTITTLASFNETNGERLNGGLVTDGSGNLYGTTSEDGFTFGPGTVFELAKGNSTITTLASFNGTNGSGPNGGLIMDGSGNLYGTAAGGGPADEGTIFELRMSTSGTTVPLISGQPSSQTVTSGAEASFTASANGNPTPTVQWQVSTDDGNTFSDISGATSTTLTLSNVTSSMSGNEYQAVFTNSVGTTFTSAATLTVNASPVVTTNPNSQTATAGATATFTAAASGNPTPAVQWQVSSNSGNSFSDISGATSTTLTLNNVTTAMNSDEYRAVFSNSAGNATTNAATLTVTAAASAPTLTLQPSSLSVAVGQTATFAAAASGTPPPAVQWQVSTDGGKTFNDISGATSTKLTLSNVTVAMSGYEYEAVFSNGIGSPATTSAATLTVNSASGSTTLTPGNATLTFNSAGLSMHITATVASPSGVVNEGAVTFTVLNNGTSVGSAPANVVNGQASATLSLPSLSAGTYTITESYHDSAGNFSDNSGNGNLTVNPAATSISANNITITINSSSVQLSASINTSNGVVTQGTLTFSLVVAGTSVASVNASVVNGHGTVSLTLPNLSGLLVRTDTVSDVSPMSLPTGIFTINESYHDSAGDFSDSSGSSQLTVNSAPISTSLTPGNATLSYNASALSVPISATITGGSGTVNQGTVTFTVMNNGSAVGSAQSSVVNGQASATMKLPSLPAGNYTITESYHDSNGGFSDSSGNGHLIIAQPPPPPTPPTPPLPPPLGPPPLNVPPLLAMFDSLLEEVETVNGNSTETITDSIFGIPLLVSTFDSSGKLESILLFGINVTALFELL